jgi:type IV pilus assembly protein PilW
MLQHSSKGFSLVELLIAGLLGLILLGGVIQLFLGSKQTYSMQQQLSSVQTDGRFAMLFIERLVENAGWYEDVVPTVSSGIDYAQTVEGGALSDAVAVQFEAPAGTGVDCNGSAVIGTVVTNRLFVNGTTLECQGNGGAAAQPVIENVDSFQVLFGVDSDSDGVINQYVTSAAVVAGGLQTRVLALQIAILISTNEDVTQANEQRSYDALDFVVNTNDRRVRRLFKKTIMMPNQAFALITSRPSNS